MYHQRSWRGAYSLEFSNCARTAMMEDELMVFCSSGILGEERVVR